MFQNLLHWRWFKGVTFVVLAAFLAMIPAESGYAQVIAPMPPPGEMTAISDSFSPACMVGMRMDLKNPFNFYFVMNKGEQYLEADIKKNEYNKLIKYFLASLTTPNNDMWVNLSPYESTRIIPDNFAGTEMGRDLLAQDYLLKQFASSLMYPEDETGKLFWERVYSRAQEEFGTTDIPVDTFNKVWIVPDRADIYQKDDTVFLVDSHLKVMMEQDFMAIEENKEMFGNVIEDQSGETDAARKIASDVVREVIIPIIEKEVNEGSNFAQVRQIYNSMILAAWFKKTLKESLLGQVYADKSKVAGVEVNDPQAREKIYQQYLEAYKVGVFNYIKEDMDPLTQEMLPRKYFSGGALPIDFDRAARAVGPQRAAPVLQAAAADSRLDAAQVTLVTVSAGARALIVSSTAASPVVAATPRARAQADFSRIAEDQIGTPQELRDSGGRPVSRMPLRSVSEVRMAAERVLEQTSNSAKRVREELNGVIAHIRSGLKALDELEASGASLKDVEAATAQQILSIQVAEERRDQLMQENGDIEAEMEATDSVRQHLVRVQAERNNLAKKVAGVLKQTDVRRDNKVIGQMDATIAGLSGELLDLTVNLPERISQNTQEIRSITERLASEMPSAEEKKQRLLGKIQPLVAKAREIDAREMDEDMSLSGIRDILAGEVKRIEKAKGELAGLLRPMRDASRALQTGIPVMERLVQESEQDIQEKVEAVKGPIEAMQKKQVVLRSQRVQLQRTQDQERDKDRRRSIADQVKAKTQEIEEIDTQIESLRAGVAADSRFAEQVEPQRLRIMELGDLQSRTDGILREGLGVWKGVSERAARAQAGIWVDADQDDVGGITMSDKYLRINIKLDGAGMPLPASMQDPAMVNIEGLSPIIREIGPVTPQNLPVLNDLMRMVVR